MMSGRNILAALILLGAAVQATAADHPPKIQITVDDTAVRQLIALTEAKDTSDAGLDKWLDLPANRYLLQVGAQENNLTRAQLRANALAVINGTATRDGPPDDMGHLSLSPLDRYKRMLDDLKVSLPDRVARIVARDAAFSPPGTDVRETVYLHLGGDWDAVNAGGAVYVNIRYWTEDFRPSWDGLNMIVAHETMHTVQNAAYGNPERQDEADPAFLTALSKIQREGIARYVEYDTDPGPYVVGTYGFFYRAIDSERLRAFPQDVALLQQLYDACYPRFDHDRFVAAFQAGDGNGGPYYDIGHGIAQALDQRLGRAVLIETVQKGPKDFFGRYAALCAKDSSLPKLPPDVAGQIARMKERL